MQINNPAPRHTVASSRPTMQLRCLAAPHLRQTSFVKHTRTVTVSAAQPLVDPVSQADLLDTQRIPIGSLAAMAAEGKLELQQNTSSVAFNSRKMASSLVLPVLQGRNTPPLVLEAGQEGLHVREGSQRLRALLAFVLGSSSVGGQHWPSAPVELESRDAASIR